MNTCTLIPENSDRMLGELVALESMMAMAAGLLTWAKPRHDELMTVLDHLTRPDPYPQPVAVMDNDLPAMLAGLPSVVPQRRYVPPGYVYKGFPCRAESAIGVYRGVMQRLVQEYPERMDAVQSAMLRIGRSRCYLSRERGRLFPGMDPAWVEAHSIGLPGGWWLDTNLNNVLKYRLLRAAVTAVGLAWGDDVSVRLQGAFETIRPDAK